MSANKAEEIIRQAMADRSVYDAMAAREKEVWGEILPDLERSEAGIEDAKASGMLGIDRHTLSLIGIAVGKKLRFKHGLVLGCGAGRLERELLR